MWELHTLGGYVLLLLHKLVYCRRRHHLYRVARCTFRSLTHRHVAFCECSWGCPCGNLRKNVSKTCARNCGRKQQKMRRKVRKDAELAGMPAELHVFAENCGFGPNHETCCIVRIVICAAYLLGSSTSRAVQITYTTGSWKAL